MVELCCLRNRPFYLLSFCIPKLVKSYLTANKGRRRWLKCITIEARNKPSLNDRQILQNFQAIVIIDTIDST